jgi:vacuolar protein sorting-associated protein 41
LIELYCRYKPEQLLNFLQSHTDYNEQLGIKICENYKMFKEEAFLYSKMGREREAIEVLVKNCSNFSETIDFALQLKFSDQSLMWDNLILIAS